MKRIKKIIQQKEFLKYFIVFFSGTLIAQLINILISPMLTRIYSPEEYGIYGSYIALISLLLVFVTGRYEFSINTAENDTEAKTIFVIIRRLAVFISGLFLIIFFFFGNLIKQYAVFQFPDNILLLVPITLLLMGILLSSTYALNRYKNFNSLSKSKVLQSTGNASSSLTLGYLNFGVIGLVLGNIIGLIVSNLYQSVIISRKKEFRKKHKNILKTMKKYKEYPLYNMPSAFFDSLSMQGPILILLHFFTESVVGFYSLTTRIVGLPLTLISTSVSQVFLSQISELKRENKSYKKIVIKVARYLAIIGIVPVVILGVFGPRMFSFIFGSEWYVAGEYAQLLIIGYYFKFVVSPLSVIFFINKRVKILSVIQTCRAFSTIAILIVLALFVDIETLLLVYSLHEAVFYLIYFYFILKTSK